MIREIPTKHERSRTTLMFHVQGSNPTDRRASSSTVLGSAREKRQDLLAIMIGTYKGYVALGDEAGRTCS